MDASQPPLFDAAAPAGFLYHAEFLTEDEAMLLTAEISRVEFATFEMRGVAARRRVAFFGRTYEADARTPPPLPEFLLALRKRVAAWAGLTPEAFEMALINEYPIGAPIGWHRDAPPYGVVAGVSLLSACRMRFRPYIAPTRTPPTTRRTATHEVILEPRSAYLMADQARSAYEHHIPPVKAPRYSITFRTMR